MHSRSTELDERLGGSSVVDVSTAFTAEGAQAGNRGRHL